MLDRIKEYLSEAKGSARLTEQLPEEQVALCAILLETAEADRQFLPEEYKEIVLQLRAYFGLSKKQVEGLIALTEEERAKSNDLWPFTHAIARTYTPEKKAEVLAMVWQVIFADNRLDPYEEQLARRLQSLLSVNHSVLMAAKAKAREIQRAREDRPD